ncbi:hypothetical protein LMG27952_06927 [Paraburkholderia hiiakae]|uniref:NAD-dependent epimerase/dehydratase domain-containing protein n=2 Tax=Paraburkholderia hiiakae TaxID=1081782 RepID=A0ABM8P964_9BURK|nr:hypothetical protein LMG27952_06927 [Paraburkholderia hiiakae]
MSMQAGLTVGVTGARGFIGRHLVATLLERPGTRVRVLSRESTGPDAFPPGANVDAFIGDLGDARSLSGFLDGLDYLINLAHPETSTDAAAEALCDQLVDACCTASVLRFIHVSTATVVGTTPAKRVDETTPCCPASDYERRKWLIEQRLTKGLAGRIDFAVLRPTAVFGPNSRNLRKLTQTIAYGPPWKRHLLRFIHGRRRMHLLPVEDMVRAIMQLLASTHELAGQTYLVACDDHADNHYQAVDALLGEAMGKPLPERSAALPSSLLNLGLRAAGRSQSEPSLHFDESKLRAFGIRSGVDFREAVQRFARGYGDSAGERE